MRPELPLTLLGRLMGWQARQRADGRGMLWVGWLRHHHYGLLGIYIPAPAQTPEPPVSPERRWVQVSGMLQPLRVLAHPAADPRSEIAFTECPLLLHALTITPCARTTSLPPPAQQLMQVKPGRWLGQGYLAPTRHFADLFCFTPFVPQQPAAMLTWERVYGIVRTVGTRRYLRYVLAH